MALTGALVALALVLAAAGGLYGVAYLLRLGGTRAGARPFLSGHDAAEHAVSRFHVRWYAITMIFLAFDMEMVFMYPWAVVVAEQGAKAVTEMFVFLGILLVGVVYAGREGALRWT
ncbi:NADH dehydrogenase subunit A [Prauserella shujinwangii]|uniref:NADH-quinone oxidoreductase subunit n=1 Tax=Prauserella shujinwangii TaxID=1453103 RepID=A0A2T0LR32_9PSEU|nr:NADH-quinone oxidoreductase subunit A [Prauserella shujinwangii]PRX45960.1 NADH dehydrogenase subunit A [Prauserella shujinwangii]